MKGVENDDERGHLLHLNSVPPGKLLFQAHVIEAQPQGVLLSLSASQTAYALRKSLEKSKDQAMQCSSTC